MCLLVGVLLAEVLLVGVLPLVVLLALVGKMVLVAFELLEKGKTPPELEMPEEGGGVATLWHFAYALVPLAPFLFCWLDWGASTLLLLVLADALVC